MRSIYSAARDSVIFLGAATDGSNTLLNAIHDPQSQTSKASTKGVVVRCIVAASGLRKKKLLEMDMDIPGDCGQQQSMGTMGVFLTGSSRAPGLGFETFWSWIWK